MLGVEVNKIKNIGIFVWKSFMDVFLKDFFLDKYMINLNMFILFIMGGGDGFFGKGILIFKVLEFIFILI